MTHPRLFGNLGMFGKSNTRFDSRLVMSEVNPFNALEDQATVVFPLSKFGKVRRFGKFGRSGKLASLTPCSINLH